MQQALAKWQALTQYAFTFDLYVGLEEGFEAEVSPDGISRVFFVSSAPEIGSLGVRYAGYTQVYHTKAGRILEFDLILNDVDFTITTDPALTTYEQEGWFGRTVLLDDVLVHELGHGFGLGHTAMLESTMFPFAWSDQAEPECADLTALRGLLDTQGGQAITGWVADERGRGQLGAQVLAIQADAGLVRAGALTDRLGRFRVEGLPPGTYHLVAGPYLAGDTSLPAYYRGADPGICPGGRSFSRTVPADADGRLVPVEVVADRPTDAGVLQVRCTADGGAAVASLGAGFGFTTAHDLQTGDGRFAVVDVAYTGSDATYYRLSGATGSLVLDVLAYRLFSPARVIPRLYADDGSEIPTTTTPLGPATSWDVRLTAASLPPGDVYLGLEANRLVPEVYPLGEDFLDPEPFVVLVGEVGPDAAQADLRCGDALVLPEVPVVDGEPWWVVPLDSADDAPERGCGCAAGGDGWAWGVGPFLRRRR